jgi:hypothetical protein
MAPVEPFNSIAILSGVPAATALSILTIAATNHLEEVPGEFAKGDVQPKSIRVVVRGDVNVLIDPK